MENMTKEEKIYNLIYEKLSPGMEIKNYNKFCELLEISNERGNTKKANLKIIERCCDYEQKGQKFIIKEIYSHPKEKEKKVGNRAIYVPLIETILSDIVRSHPSTYLGGIIFKGNMCLKIAFSILLFKR